MGSGPPRSLTDRRPVIVPVEPGLAPIEIDQPGEIVSVVSAVSCSRSNTVQASRRRAPGDMRN